MDVFLKAAIAALVLSLSVTAGEQSNSAPAPPAGTAGGPLQQPDWMRPHRTVLLAQLPRPAKPTGEKPNDPTEDIGELYSAATDDQPIDGETIRDEKVRPASARSFVHDPEAAQKLLDHARALAKQSTELADFDRVLDMCHQAIEAGPTPAQAAVLGRFGAWASNARGECLLDAGNEFAAFEAFQEAVMLDPSCWEALHNRAVTLAANNKPRQALDDFARVVELEPKFATAYRNRGELLKSLGEHQSALADYTKAIEHEPRVAGHRHARAVVHHQLGHWADAVKDLDVAIRLDASRPEPFVLRGEIYQLLGYWEQAIADYQQALAANPRSQSAYQGLAWLLATCPDNRYRDGAKAVESARRAELFAIQKNVRLLDTLAAAHAEARDYSSAIRYVEQAIVISSPTEAEAMRARLALYRDGKPYRAENNF
jgi:tetratricopeptide (TPR) repeat protein